MYDPDLIYDVGMHLGEDTEYYLKKGFRVIAFEANPELVASCERRFIDQIKSGQLSIVEGAVAPASFGDTITLYQSSVSGHGTIHADLNKRNSELGWSSIRPSIQVKRIDFVDIVVRYGIPFYLKIDIEGSDRYVLSTLGRFPSRPKYISLEAERANFSNLESELRMLRDLGYDKFKAIQQATIPGSSIITKDLVGSHVEHTFSDHSSGGFGDDLEPPWESYDQVLKTYRRIFKYYHVFGDRSVLRQVYLRSGLKSLLRTHLPSLTGRPLIRRPLLGWYDTHASR